MMILVASFKANIKHIGEKTIQSIAKSTQILSKKKKKKKLLKYYSFGICAQMKSFYSLDNFLVHKSSVLKLVFNTSFIKALFSFMVLRRQKNYHTLFIITNA